MPAKELWRAEGASDSVRAAMKAMNTGEATGGQQQLFLEWLWAATRVRDEVFDPTTGKADGRRVTDYLLGRRSIGLQIAREIALVQRVDKVRGTGPHAVPVGAPPGEE